MISIVIPAHNEEDVITRCLTPLLPGIENKELEIIVVCNGCTDKTPQIVKGLDESIELIEIPLPSKINALNIGDTAASGFPRFYLDADVLISLETVRKIAHVLDSDSFLAAIPQVKMNHHHSSWMVKSYYEIWRSLPYVYEAMAGTGVYALSKLGRERLGKFPDIINDDGYIRVLFTSREKCSVPDCFVEVTAPLTVKDLIKIKTRIRLGEYELWQKFPQLKRAERKQKNYGNALRQLIRQPELWHKIPAYLFVNIFSRIKANKRLKENDTAGWERDHSSRTMNMP